MSIQPTPALPDPLAGAGREAWEHRIRPALVAIYRQTMYGPVPQPMQVRAAIRARHVAAFDARSARFEIALRTGIAGMPQEIAVSLYLPPPARRPPPLFFGPNYAGNASVDPDPAIAPDAGWMRPEPDWGVVANRATDATRGVHAGRWPLATILARGYAVATWHDGSFCTDDPELSRPVRAAGFGGAIAAWAWAFSRVLDGLADLELIDPTRTAAIGHSRHGKAALWAGACDPRIALVVANNSGTGGAKLFRHTSGETIADLFERFPHWFAEPLRAFAGRENELPFDQHLLIGLCAPRAVYVASARDDSWAGPVGEHQATLAAAPIYSLYGPGTPLPGHHLRDGGHGVTAYDWDRYLDFADRVLR
jgi:hypothetical protein